MVTLICDNCEREIEVTEKVAKKTHPCKECGETLRIKGEESEEDTIKCTHCGRIISEDEDSYCCDECGDEDICKECYHVSDEYEYLCKKCVDRLYPRKVETKIIYKDKIIEKPIIVNNDGSKVESKFNPSEKTKFD